MGSQEIEWHGRKILIVLTCLQNLLQLRPLLAPRSLSQDQRLAQAAALAVDQAQAVARAVAQALVQDQAQAQAQAQDDAC